MSAELFRKAKNVASEKQNSSKDFNVSLWSVVTAENFSLNFIAKF